MSAGPAARRRPAKRSAAFLVGASLGDTPFVLPIERPAQPAHGLLRLVHAPGHRGDQSRQIKVDREVRHADRAQRIDRQQDRFGVGLGTVDPDQFGPDLSELALGLERAAANADHIAAVGQAQGAGFVLQAGHRDAGHLDRHVRPHAHHALGNGIHEAESLLRQGGAGAAEEGLLELDQRRLHPLVAERGETLDGQVDGARLPRRVWGQQVGQACRQQAAMVVIV